MKSVFFSTRLAALPLALCAAFPAYTQTQLKEVVVTASRNPQLLSSTSAHTTVISRADIETSQASDLVTLLQREAGLQRTQNGGVGASSTVFLRGMPSLDTLVLIDGIPQNKQDASGAVSLEHIMLDNVERVEIVRGNVSAIYGSGAIGGVIQVFTRTGNQKPAASLGLELGPRATAKLTANATLVSGETAVNVGVSRLTTDGFSSINTEQLSGANPDADGYQNLSSNLSLAHKLSAGHSVGVQVTQSAGDNKYDNYFGAPTDQQYSVTRLNQTTIYTDNTWGNWRSRLSVSEQSDKSINADDGTFGSVNGFNTQATVLRWVNSVAVAADWLATAGFEEQRQHIDTNTTDAFSTPYSKDRTGNAVFLGLEGAFGDSTVQINLRNDRVGELQQSTAYLGVGYAINSEFKVLANTSTAFNAPPLGYLFAPVYGNAALKPELAKSSELGLQYEKGAHLVRATYFDTQVQDQLLYDTATSAFANINRTRNSGVELSYRATIGDTEVRASVTDQNPVDDTTGKILQRRARTMVGLGIGQTIDRLRLGADVRFAGERPDKYTDPVTFASVNTSLAAYSVLDLTASYRWSPEVLFKARLDNATDEKYQTVYGYNQQPRSLYAGFVWTPKL